ncbi:MAG: tetratricopeptide repeat protein, partial [Acidobacteriota bacterium]
YREARELARRALAIDTYDPAANYYYGLASAALAKPYDARDGFEIAAQSTEFRPASYTELARLYLREGDLPRARDYSNKALDFNQQNLEAWQIRAIIARLARRTAEAQAAHARILAIDPLNHLVRFEKSLLSARPADRRAVGRLIRNEMPHETWLEMAIWYAGLKLYRESADLLTLAPEHPEIAYWRAWLSQQRQTGDVDRLLTAADRLSPRFVFPFRPETAPILEWAIGREKDNDGSWKPRYYLALLNWSLGRSQEAGQLFAACGNRPDYAPFYATRAAFTAATGGDRADADPLPDALTAARLDPRQWRYGKLLIEHYLAARPAQPALALEVAQRYFEADPTNYKIGILYARTLIVNRQFAPANQLLATLKILPYEGSTEGRTLYREARLGMALKYIRDKQHISAITALNDALRWPENLGVGKPYPEDVDERLEELLAASQFQLDRRPDIGRKLLERVATPRQTSSPAGPILTALALQRLGRTDEAEKMAATITSPPWREWTRQILSGQRPAPPPTDLLELRILGEWLQN